MRAQVERPARTGKLSGCSRLFALSVLVAALTSVVISQYVIADPLQEAVNQTPDINLQTSKTEKATQELASPIVAPEKIETPKADAKLNEPSPVEAAVSPKTADKDAVLADPKEDLASSSSSSSSKQQRQARSEPSATSSSDSSSSTEANKSTSGSEKDKSTNEKKSSESKPTTSTAAKQSKPSSSSSSKTVSKPKHQANIGSGGGGMYKHKPDEIAKIVELQHNSVAHKMKASDNRRTSNTGFGGVQKASAIGDMFSPIKGVTDSGLARTLGASMRSIMKSKYSVPAYVASALLGAVAILSFYESPISPLPVPALPEPPVGRFPPEQPNLPPGVQIPFRTNQQGQYGMNYNQRTSYPNNLATANQQQVYFPGNGNNLQPAQQRQMSSSGSATSPLSVGSLANNLLGKQQVAQRKSGVDFEQPRSFLGPLMQSNSLSQPKFGSNSLVGQNAQQKSSTTNSILNFFGLGGSQQASSSSPGHQVGTNGDPNGAQSSPLVSTLVSNSPSMPNQAMGASSGSGPMSAAANSPLEPKNPSHNGGSASIFSGSNLVNKVKSYFAKAPSSFLPASLPSLPIGPGSDQYSRINFIQSFMKDAANLGLPRLLTPNNRKSSPPAPSSVSGANQNNNGQMNAANMFNMQNQQLNAASRMQLGPETQLPVKAKTGASSGGLGLVRIAHALLETLNPGIGQRSMESAQQKSAQAMVDGAEIGQPLAGQSANVDAGSAIASDVSSSFNGLSGSNFGLKLAEQSNQDQSKVAPASSYSQQQQQQQQQQPSASQEAQISSAAADSSALSGQVNKQSSSIARSSDAQDSVSASSDSVQHPNKSSSLNNSNTKPTQQAAQSSAASEQHVRKVRSIGFEYPIENGSIQYPSRAAQINSIVDYVSDSYSQNKMLFNFLMNQVGLSQAVPYVEQILASGPGDNKH